MATAKSKTPKLEPVSAEEAKAEGTVPAEVKELSEQEKLNKSYSIASNQLRELYRDDFNRLRKQAARDLGVEWTPKPTAEEKAEAQLRELLAEHPGLAEKLAARPAENQVAVDDDDVAFEDVPMVDVE